MAEGLLVIVSNPRIANRFDSAIEKVENVEENGNGVKMCEIIAILYQVRTL